MGRTLACLYIDPTSPGLDDDRLTKVPQADGIKSEGGVPQLAEALTAEKRKNNAQPK